MRIVQISDTHLTHRGGLTNRNFERLVDFVNNDIKPDLVVNSGDVALLSPDSDQDREAARELHSRFNAPVRLVPGNHDVGEPGDKPWAGISVTADRVAAFRAAFGSDYWLEVSPDVAVIGLNSEVMGSGLDEEEEQWRWLDGAVDKIGHQPVLVFLHKPLWTPMKSMDHALTIDEHSRTRLLALLSNVDLRSIGSGHLHLYRYATEGDLLTMWAPSTAFIVKSARLGDGLNQLGVVEYRLEEGLVDASFRSVPHLEETEPWQMPEFVAAWDEVGAGPLPGRPTQELIAVGSRA